MHTMDYLAVLTESLQKKVEILDKIIEKNKVQRLILTDDHMNPDAFEENLTGKSDLIDKLNQLDDGFGQIYQRVKTIIEGDKSKYRAQIKELQRLIKQITEKSTTIQVQECRNKELAELKFSSSRQRVREVKTSKRVASQYYKNMANLDYTEPQFMDRKK